MTLGFAIQTASCCQCHVTQEATYNNFVALIVSCHYWVALFNSNTIRENKALEINDTLTSIDMDNL